MRAAHRPNGVCGPVTSSLSGTLLARARKPHAIGERYANNSLLQSTEPPQTNLLVRGINCRTVARARRAALLVDGDAYFRAFRAAAANAERSILIVAWDFDSGMSLDPRGDPELRLGTFLNDLARRRRKLHIRVLDWDYPMLFGADRELSPLYGLSWQPHRRVHFHYDDRHPPGGSQHQKIIVVDDKIAFVGGLDLTSKRWDTRQHLPRDPARMSAGKPYPPFHDVMALVDADAARALGDIVRHRWHRVTGEQLLPVETQGDPWPNVAADLRDVDIGIACTEPTGRRVGRQVERLYLDLIRRARRSIYMENQYFTANTVGRALAARLSEPHGPEVVLVTRLLSHGWLEELTMNVLRTRLIRELRAADRYGRFQVYYPHVEGLPEGTCVDVHSKVMVVDDQWLRVGSANLNNRSMGLDAECDIVIESAGSPSVSSVFEGFRNGLLAEHLGTTRVQVAAAIERHSGSLLGAIGSLQRPDRTLRVLNDLKQWPDSVLDAIAIADPERPVSLDLLFAQFAPMEELPPRRALIRNLILWLLALVALGMAWRFTPLTDWVTAERVTAWAEDFGTHWWSPLAIVLAYTPASLLLIPRPLITLAATVAFGAGPAFAYGMIGILFAGIATYGLGRSMNPRTVRHIAGERLHRVSQALRQRGLPAVIAVRCVPIAPFWTVNMVAGAIRIRLAHFLIGTAVAITPGLLMATVYGEQFSEALRDPSRVNYVLVAAITLFFIIAFVLVRAWVRRLERAARAAPAPVAGPTRTFT